jgi:hypothetical protein
VEIQQVEGGGEAPVVEASGQGVVLAAIVVFSGEAAPLAIVGPGFHEASIWIGGLVFIAVNVALYRWVARLGQARAAA